MTVEICHVPVEGLGRKQGYNMKSGEFDEGEKIPGQLASCLIYPAHPRVNNLKKGNTQRRVLCRRSQGNWRPVFLTLGSIKLVLQSNTMGVAEDEP